MSLSWLIIVVVLAVVVLVFINLLGRPIPKGIDKIYFQHEWVDVMELAKNPKTAQMSIINADKLLDEALKNVGFSGNTMGERLISAKQHLKDRDAVWNAHKLRNKIVHEKSKEPTDEQIKTALKGYYKAFKDLRVF